MNEELMLKCREEYALLPQEEQTKYLAQLSDAYGQDFVDAFTSFMETGNYPKFAEAVTTTPEFPAGELKEVPGMKNGYERTMEEVAASLNTEHAPVYEAIMSMGEELNAAPPVKQSEMMDQLASARGQEFSEAVLYTFKHPDFCEYIAREAQVFFDTLAHNFSQSKDQVKSLARIGNFSETLSKGVLSYATKGKPGNFSILESVVLLSSLARKDFSENGELAEAIMELGEGDVSPEGAETLAENIIENADGDTAEVPAQIEEIAIKADDTPETQAKEQKDMAEGSPVGALIKGAKAFGKKFVEGNKGIISDVKDMPPLHPGNLPKIDPKSAIDVPKAIEKVKEVITPKATTTVETVATPGLLGKVAEVVDHPAAKVAGAALLVAGGAYAAKKLADRNKTAKAMKAAGAFSENDIATSAPAPATEPAPVETAPVDDQTVVREKEQNNAMLDAVIEKYKALQTEEAKAQMVAEMQQLLAPELVEYIIARAEGEDFSEGTTGEGEVEPKAVADGINPAESPAAEAESGDVDRYEVLSKELLGEYEENPIGKVVAAEAPQAVATLPEGAPVAATEGGTTMAEDYEREPVIDKYEEMGLL